MKATSPQDEASTLGGSTQRHWSGQASAEGTQSTWFPRVGANTSCEELPQCMQAKNVSLREL